MPRIKETRVFLDLFAGCGGLSLGLLTSGWQGLFAAEKDELAFETLKSNLIDGKAPFRYHWPGKACSPWTRGILQRRHITAGKFNYCEQGPVDHEADFKVKIYESGRISAEPETIRILAEFSERQIEKATGLQRKTIRKIRWGEPVRRSTFQKVIDFLKGKYNRNN